MTGIPWPTVPGYRDQFTPAQEREMEERERWEEENCECVDEASERTCRVHGDPEVVGMSRIEEPS